MKNIALGFSLCCATISWGMQPTAEQLEVERATRDVFDAYVLCFNKSDPAGKDKCTARWAEALEQLGIIKRQETQQPKFRDQLLILFDEYIKCHSNNISDPVGKNKCTVRVVDALEALGIVKSQKLQLLKQKSKDLQKRQQRN